MAILAQARWSPANRHKVTLDLVLGFGAFDPNRDERFVKLKTVLYAFMALALGFGLWC
jgi:hypothetical protein